MTTLEDLQIRARSMRNTMTSVREIREALQVKGSVLIKNQRADGSPFFVEVTTPTTSFRIPCSNAADRLTYGKNRLAFVRRDALEIVYG